MAGTELIRIADLDNMQAEVEVNENDVLRVKIGDTTDIEVDAYRQKKFQGVVTQIAYSSGTSVGIVSTSQAINFTVKIKLIKSSYQNLINADLGHAYPFRPGMSCTVDIRTKTKEQVLSVPIQAITTRERYEVEGKEKVSKKSDDDAVKKDLVEVAFVLNQSKVRLVTVKSGIQDASYIEVIEGLKDGDKVVKAPFKLVSKGLKNGDIVKVVEEKDLYNSEEDKKDK
jgi:HlyD family secretion protein